MGISRIGSLFASNADMISRMRAADERSAAIEESRSAREQSSAPRPALPSSDAVVFSSSLTQNRKRAESEDSQREQKVRRLKDEVQGGQYRTDSDKVAVAVLKDLT